jgi:hypothetical protein
MIFVIKKYDFCHTFSKYAFVAHFCTLPNKLFDFGAEMMYCFKRDFLLF